MHNVYYNNRVDSCYNEHTGLPYDMQITSRGPRYQFRTSLSVSVEASILQRTKDVAAEKRMTLSEIVNAAFVEFVTRHEVMKKKDKKEEGREYH